MTKAVLFSFRDGMLGIRHGFVRQCTQYKKTFFELKYIEDEKIGMIKPTREINPVFVDNKEGRIFNHFIWFEVSDDQVFNEDEYVRKAAEIFRTKVEHDLRKKEKEINKLYLDGAYLNDLLV